MFYYLTGVVAHMAPFLAVIDCGGVGYGCRVTAYTAGQLKLNQTARLYVSESIREDAYDLYGFISREEQRCYELLTSVNGVGPKAAMAILSSGGPQNFILELKDKLGGGAMELDFSTGSSPAAPAAKGNNAAMAYAALQELGYAPAEINAALKGVAPTATTEEMIRHALRAMVMKG